MERPVKEASRTLVAGTMCQKCQENVAILIARLEAVCSDCFQNYVRAKFAKRMGSYRVLQGSKDQKIRKMLLGLSYGPSSTTLLTFLDRHVQAQLDKTGREGYQVIVAYIDCGCIDNSQPLASHLQVLQRRYPKFQYVSIGLEDIYKYKHAMKDESTRSEELKHATTQTMNGQDAESQYIDNLRSLISSLPSRNSQMDIIELLRTRLLIETAKDENCEAIFFGHTTTRLAEKILSETAKGRGRSIPWLVADGPSPYGLTIQYPLRDVHKKELDSYVNIAGLGDLCISLKTTKTPISSRNQSIDELISQYFVGVDESFPSVIANVVRTAGKLVTTNSTAITDHCSVCGLPKDVDIPGWIKDEDQDDRLWSMTPIDPGVVLTDQKTQDKMCYGCRRTTLSANNLQWPL